MIRVTWEVDDGYVGNRPHHIDLDDSEFEDDMTEEDRREVIESIIREEFEQKIGWYITRIEDR